MAIKCTIENVTPDKAAEWLKANTHNRKITSYRVEYYAAQMKRGDWHVSNSGIGFDDSGRLLDGQHRLAAIVESKTAVEMLVVTGLSELCQITLDQPLVRKAHDQITLSRNVEVGAYHIAIAKMMMRGLQIKYRLQLDMLTLDKFYAKYHKSVEFALSCFTKRVPRITLAAVLAPVARAYYTVSDKDRLKEFADVLLTGQSEKRKDFAAITLRNYLLQSKLSTRDRADAVTIYARTEAALVAFVEGKSITRLRDLEAVKEEAFAIPTLVKRSSNVVPMKRQA